MTNPIKAQTMMSISGELRPTLKSIAAEVAPIGDDAAFGILVEVGNEADVEVSSSDRAST